MVAGSAGATAKDGKPYTAASFLSALRGEDQPIAIEPPQQSLDYMQSLLMVWTDASNKEFAEGKVVKDGKRVK